MEIDTKTAFREISTGNLAIDGKEATLLRDTFRHVEPGRIPWLNTARLYYGSTLHNIEVWEVDTSMGVLSSAIKQAIEDKRHVTAEGIVGKGDHLVNRESSFTLVGGFLLLGHSRNENLAKGRTTHSFSLGRFGLKKALGINTENSTDNSLQTS